MHRSLIEPLSFFTIVDFVVVDKRARRGRSGLARRRGNRERAEGVAVHHAQPECLAASCTCGTTPTTANGIRDKGLVSLCHCPAAHVEPEGRRVPMRYSTVSVGVV